MEKLENTRSRVRCMRSMCRSFWPLILKQVVILTTMSNYFLSYTQIIGPSPITNTKRKPCMECPLCRLLISSRSVSKHGHHMQFLFLIGQFLKKSSPLKLLNHMNRNLVGSIYMYGRFCIKFPQSRMKGE